MVIFGLALWWIVSSIAQGLLTAAMTARSRSRQAPIPEQFSVPTSEEGRPIPVLWGTRRVRNPNLTWNKSVAPVAIVESGVTTGYKYYQTSRYIFLNNGPVDEIVDVLWNDKPIGQGVGDSNDTIAFRITGASPTLYAKLPHRNYGSSAELGAAAETAMKAAAGGTLDVKVGFGYKIIAGVNDEFVYGVRYDSVFSGSFFSKRLVRVVAGDYPTGISLAAALQSALNNLESRVTPGGSFAVSYNAVGQANKFTITYNAQDGAGYRGWIFYGSPEPTFSLARSIKSLLGYFINVNHNGESPSNESADTVHGSVPTYVNRFVFAFNGNTMSLMLLDPLFTAAGILGYDTGYQPLLLIRAGDYDVISITAVYTDHTDFLQIDIDDPTFFGTEGGVQGRIDIYKGNQDQAACPFLTAQYGATAPNYPGEVYAVLQNLYIGNNNVPKPFAITFRRCPNTLGLPDETHDIAGDSNPAAMLWEICTEQRTLLGMGESDLDKDSFLAVGATCFEEGLGLSYVLETIQTGEDLIQEIGRHIDAYVFEDPLTDRIMVSLVRANYDVDDLPLITIDNADEIKLKRADEPKNVVRLKYVSRERGYTERTVQRENLASIQSRGGEISLEESSFLGFSNEAIATTWCLRLLKLLSRPPAPITLKADRSMWKMRPGSPFRLTCEPLGITDRPCRATRVAPGPIGQSEIAIDAVEDVLGAPWTGFTAPVPPTDDVYEPPDDPIPPSGFVVIGEEVMPTI